MNTFVLGNLFVGFFLKAVLSTMFSAINSLQITAHVPMMAIQIPGQAYFMFDILIQIVAFDFLPITSIIDFKFHETQPWHQRFVWIGYGDSNAMSLFGSISLYIGWYVIKLPFVIIFAFCPCREKFTRL
jgi:hypothetical protein